MCGAVRVVQARSDMAQGAPQIILGAKVFRNPAGWQLVIADVSPDSSEAIWRPRQRYQVVMMLMLMLRLSAAAAEVVVVVVI